MRSLSKEAADRVAGHLVVAGRLVDEDPQTGVKPSVEVEAASA